MNKYREATEQARQRMTAHLLGMSVPDFGHPDEEVDTLIEAAREEGRAEEWARWERRMKNEVRAMKERAHD